MQSCNSAHLVEAPLAAIEYHTKDFDAVRVPPQTRGSKHQRLVSCRPLFVFDGIRRTLFLLAYKDIQKVLLSF